MLKTYNNYMNILTTKTARERAQKEIKEKKIVSYNRLAMVEFALRRASIGPDPTESTIPYISMFPAKLCSIHLKSTLSLIEIEFVERKEKSEGTLFQGS